MPRWNPEAEARRDVLAHAVRCGAAAAAASRAPTTSIATSGVDASEPANSAGRSSFVTAAASPIPGRRTTGGGQRDALRDLRASRRDSAITDRAAARLLRGHLELRSQAAPEAAPDRGTGGSQMSDLLSLMKAHRRRFGYLYESGDEPTEPRS